MKTKHHMAVNIEGMLRFHHRKKITVMEDDNGRRLSDYEARKYLQECLAKGYKLMPNSECDGFDPFGKGCPGHVIEE